MTNPTTPFNWQMPTASDLVTDLPADFETFGQAVATSMADLLGGTTGQILAKASNTDMDFTWVTNDVGDITAVNTTAPLAGGGTSGALTLSIAAATTSVAGAVQLSDSTSTTSSVLAATPTAVKSAYDLANGAIPKTLIDAAGDLIVGTAADTAGRLGIGTAGQVLKVNTGATALEWGTASSTPTAVGCYVYKNGTNQSIANTTVTNITFQSEQFDTNSLHDNTTNNSRITIPAGYAGKYQINANVNFAGNATGDRELYIYVNNSAYYCYNVQKGTSSLNSLQNSLIVNLAAADYIEIKVWQDSGGALNVLSDYNCNFSVGYLGA